jgi:hypothetical protein
MCVEKGILANGFIGPHLFEHPKLARLSIKRCVRNVVEIGSLRSKAVRPASMIDEDDENFVDIFSAM